MLLATYVIYVLLDIPIQYKFNSIRPIYQQILNKFLKREKSIAFPVTINTSASESIFIHLSEKTDFYAIN